MCNNYAITNMLWRVRPKGARYVITNYPWSNGTHRNLPAISLLFLQAVHLHVPFLMAIIAWNNMQVAPIYLEGTEKEVAAAPLHRRIRRRVPSRTKKPLVRLPSQRYLNLVVHFSVVSYMIRLCLWIVNMQLWWTSYQSQAGMVYLGVLSKIEVKY